jgi:hypothetical protein
VWQEVHPGAACGPEGARRRIGRQQLAAGAPPAPGAYNAHARRTRNPFHDIEWSDHTALDPGACRIGTGQRDDLTGIVQTSVNDAPACAADSNEIARLQFLHCLSADRLQKVLRQDAELTRNRGYSAHRSDDGPGIGKVSATAEVRGSVGGGKTLYRD